MNLFERRSPARRSSSGPTEKKNPRSSFALIRLAWHDKQATDKEFIKFAGDQACQRRAQQKKRSIGPTQHWEAELG
jgi:hypothetical protein